MPARTRKPKAEAAVEEDNVIQMNGDAPDEEPEAEVEEQPEQEADWITFVGAKYHFHGLGVAAAASVAGLYDNISNVTYSAAEKKIGFVGPEEETSAAKDQVTDVWNTVIRLHKEHKKATREERAEAKKKSLADVSAADKEFFATNIARVLAGEVPVEAPAEEDTEAEEDLV